MRSFRKYVALALCLSLAAGAVNAQDAEQKKPARQEKGEKKSAKEKSKKSGKETKTGKDKDKDTEKDEGGDMNLPLEKGHDSFGLKIPYENSEGVLQMMFTVGRASRLDENHVKMMELQVETFDDEGKSEMVIDLPESVLDITTRLLTTDKEVTIRRSDFEITGQSMEFDTKTKHGRLAGNVRMLIYEQPEPTQPSAAAPVTNEEPEVKTQ